MTATTMIHELADGRKIEFRRHPDPAVYMQHRELRRDGFPHDGRWYPVSDWLLLRMQEVGSDIVQTLADG